MRRPMASSRTLWKYRRLKSADVAGRSRHYVGGAAAIFWSEVPASLVVLLGAGLGLVTALGLAGFGSGFSVVFAAASGLTVACLTVRGLPVDFGSGFASASLLSASGFLD